MPEQVVARPPLSKVSLIFACGTALFSDGYANHVVGTVNTLLVNIYGKNVLDDHNRGTLLSSLAFAGTIVGMLVFGYISDKIGRKFGMMSATAIVILFSFLSACSQGANGSVNGLLAALAAFRFLLGIGIGAEYPCGSVAASEQSEEVGISKRAQHRWVGLATNTMLTFGSVIANFVPLVLLWIFGPNHLAAVWRGALGFGIIPAFVVFIWRLRMEEPTMYKTDSMKYAKVPYMLILKRYWLRLAAISAVWLIYDFIVYPFGLFSSIIVDSIIGDTSSLTVVFGWSVVISLFSLPGTVLGSFVVDYLGPRNTMLTGLLLQAVIGFIMSGCYPQLKEHIAGFAILYGIFQSLGGFGTGVCTIIIAAKSGPTGVRGQFYGVAAAAGKVGALVGTWAFPPMIEAFGGSKSNRGNSGPFFVASGLAVLNAIITYFYICPLDADGMTKEDAEFRIYLEQNGYDISQLGLREIQSSDSAASMKDKDSVVVDEKAV